MAGNSVGLHKVGRRDAIRLLGCAAAAAGASVLAACGAAGSPTGQTKNSGPTPSSSPAWAGITQGTGRSLVRYQGGTLTMTTRGNDCWGTQDTCTYVYTQAPGDGIWVVRVASLKGTSNDTGWSKAGIMLRSSTTDSSADVFLVVTDGNGVKLQYRETDGANETGNDAVLSQSNGGVAPIWLRLQKMATTYLAWYSTDGRTWNGQTGASGSGNIMLSSQFLVGVAGTSHDATTHGQAVFTNWQGPLLTTADLVGTNDSAT